MSETLRESGLPGTPETTTPLPPTGQPEWAAGQPGTEAGAAGENPQQPGWGTGQPMWGAAQPGWNQQGQPGWPAGGPVWAPPAGGWPPFPGAVQPTRQPERKRGVPFAAAGVLILLAAAAGVGIGHVAWHSPSPVSITQSGNSSTLPGLGDGGTGNSGTGSGTSPFSFGSGGGTSGGSGSGSGSGSTTQGSGSPSDVSTIAAEVSPALVDINSTFGYQSASGAGTGIVLTSTGEILTNNHVIDGATSISVTDIGNGKTYSATVVGYDSTHDVAVLQLANASGLKTAKLADSSKVTVGTGVVAIGNAGGTGGTPSSAGGSVTALNQSITASDELDGTSEQLSGLIQVNADVQSGDSGGSLVNSSGEVIGMDTAASGTYSFQSSSGSSGFAIPINAALAIADQIKAGQSSTDVHVGATAFLGVLVTPSSSSNGGTGGQSQTQSGAAVSGVLSGTTAANAGLVKGDTITSLDGQSVSSAAALTKVVASLKPGQHVELGWVDSSGQSHTATVDMGSGPPA